MTEKGVKKEEEIKEPVSWYFKPAAIALAIIAVGPLALPLIILSPAIKTWQKILLSVLLIVFTVWVTRVFMDVYADLMREMKQLNDIMSS